VLKYVKKDLELKKRKIIKIIMIIFLPRTWTSTIVAFQFCSFLRIYHRTLPSPVNVRNCDDVMKKNCMTANTDINILRWQNKMACFLVWGLILKKQAILFCYRNEQNILSHLMSQLVEDLIKND
jgi:hypothetical protein